MIDYKILADCQHQVTQILTPVKSDQDLTGRILENQECKVFSCEHLRPFTLRGMRRLLCFRCAHMPGVMFSQVAAHMLMSSIIFFEYFENDTNLVVELLSMSVIATVLLGLVVHHENTPI